jgi:hypothetical protein
MLPLIYFMARNRTAPQRPGRDDGPPARSQMPPAGPGGVRLRLPTVTPGQRRR